MAYIASHLKKGITHQQRVMRLYRNSLKHLLSWCIDRESWREEALILRDRFDKYKNETNQKMIDKVLQNAEIEFENKRHPFPYIGKCCTLFPLISLLRRVILKCFAGKNVTFKQTL